MDLTGLPPNSFIAPDGSNAGAVRSLCEQFLGVLLDTATTADARPPLPDAAVELPATLPESPVPVGDLLSGLRSLVAGSMNPAHPGWIGHMDPPPALVSALGDLAAALLNNNLLSHEMSPALSRLENDMIRTFATRFGLGDRAGGVMTSGGTLANLHALVVARNVALGVKDGGLTGLARRPVVLASEAAHTSVQKAAMLMGLGVDAVIPVATDPAGRMNPESLARQVEAGRERGEQPFCVVATAGTTVTGAIDPLSDVADVAARFGLWLHVDAAYGGAVVLSDAHRHRLSGVERADSITFNPQKWLYVAKTCAMVLFRDAGLLESGFRVAAPYMRAGGVTNLGEIGVQGTRHADVLKLWLTVRHLGRTGLSRLVDEGYRLTAHLVREVRRRPFLELAGEPDSNVVCFRQGRVPDDESDVWAGRLQAHLLSEGQAFLSLPLYRGRRWLRAVLLNPYTGEETLDAVMRRVDSFAG